MAFTFVLSKLLIYKSEVWIFGKQGYASRGLLPGKTEPHVIDPIFRDVWFGQDDATVRVRNEGERGYVTMVAQDEHAKMLGEATVFFSKGEEREINLWLDVKGENACASCHRGRRDRDRAGTSHGNDARHQRRRATVPLLCGTAMTAIPDGRRPRSFREPPCLQVAAEPVPNTVAGFALGAVDPFAVVAPRARIAVERHLPGRPVEMSV